MVDDDLEEELVDDGDDTEQTTVHNVSRENHSEESAKDVELSWETVHFERAILLL